MMQSVFLVAFAWATIQPAASQEEPQASQADSVTIQGRVVFSGEPRDFQPEPFPEVEGTECAAWAPIMRENVIVNGTKPPTLSNAVVWIKDGPVDLRGPRPTGQKLLSVKNCRFDPHVTLLQEGQPLLVRNDDPFPQSVHILSTKPKARRITIPKPGMQMVMSFEAEGPIPVESAKYPWMSAWVVVLPHPFALMTQGDGGFEFVGFSPGTYEIAAWHEAFGTQTKTIDVEPGEANEVVFVFGPKETDQED